LSAVGGHVGFTFPDRSLVSSTAHRTGGRQ
jgi:hypothetical protein